MRGLAREGWVGLDHAGRRRRNGKTEIIQTCVTDIVYVWIYVLMKCVFDRQRLVVTFILCNV